MRLLLLSTLLAALAVACAAPTVDEGDPGEDLGESESLAVGGGRCSLSQQTILASVSGGRRTAIARGFEWLADGVPYSQSRYHESYRTDCSGFVSMCWQLGESYTTADFAGSSSKWKALGSYESLVPGDALVRRASGSGHIVLFVGWDDASHKGACVLEEASTASDMQFRVRTVASLKSGGFKAIAAAKLAGTGTVTDPVDVDEEPIPEEVDEEPAGASCRSDGACNPGNDGSGKICVGGRCVDGCRTNAQCPGVTTCRSGQCR